MSKRNTVADNCLSKLPRHCVGYYLKDGSFVAIDGETYDKIEKKYNA